MVNDFWWDETTKLAPEHTADELRWGRPGAFHIMTQIRKVDKFRWDHIHHNTPNLQVPPSPYTRFIQGHNQVKPLHSHTPFEHCSVRLGLTRQPSWVTNTRANLESISFREDIRDLPKTSSTLTSSLSESSMAHRFHHLATVEEFQTRASLWTVRFPWVCHIIWYSLRLK